MKEIVTIELKIDVEFEDNITKLGRPELCDDVDTPEKALAFGIVFACAAFGMDVEQIFTGFSSLATHNPVSEPEIKANGIRMNVMRPANLGRSPEEYKKLFAAADKRRDDLKKTFKNKVEE